MYFLFQYPPMRPNDSLVTAYFDVAVNRFVAEDRLPHLLLYGPPGTGKTTTVLAVARQLYPKLSQFKAAVLEGCVLLIIILQCVLRGCVVSDKCFMHSQISFQIIILVNAHNKN